MTTKYILIISVGIILLTLFSCTHNDGGESTLYGQWKLQRISVAGQDDETYPGDIYWRFQNKTIEMSRMLPHHDVLATFGNYTLAQDRLLLSFPDAERAPLLSLPRECELQVIRLKGKEMVLYYNEAATTYYLKKW